MWGTFQLSSAGKSQRWLPAGVKPPISLMGGVSKAVFCPFYCSAGVFVRSRPGHGAIGNMTHDRATFFYSFSEALLSYPAGIMK